MRDASVGQSPKLVEALKAKQAEVNQTAKKARMNCLKTHESLTVNHNGLPFGLSIIFAQLPKIVTLAQVDQPII